MTSSGCARTIVLCFVAACGHTDRSSFSPSRDPAGPAAPSQGILFIIGDALRAANPRIDEASILEIRAPFPDSPKRAALARGVRGDHRFQGDFRDELFGLFVMNDSLTRIEATLDILPTRRWLDYEFRLGRVTADSVYLTGKGASYGDLPMARAYAW